MRELSVITYPHLRILPITSADNPRNISPQFTRLNIRTSAAPHIRILPEATAVSLSITLVLYAAKQEDLKQYYKKLAITDIPSIK